MTSWKDGPIKLQVLAFGVDSFFLPIKLLVALFWGDCQVFLMLLLDLFEKYFKMPRKNLK